MRIAASSRASRDELVDGGVVGEAERAQRRPLADVAQELVDGADRGARPPVASDLRGRRDAERDADQRQLAIARPEVEARAPPGRTVASAVPWASRPRVPIAWPSAWTSPTPVPLAWPTPGEVRGHEHLRARLEVRAVGDGAAAATSRPSG